MALVSRCSLIQNLSDMLPLCEHEDDKNECLQLMSKAFELIQNPSSYNTQSVEEKTDSIILPASMLLGLLKKSLNWKNNDNNETETETESKFEMTSFENPKKVRIQEPEVSSINLIPTNEENKAYQTSTHFPSKSDDYLDEDETTTNTEHDDLNDDIYNNSDVDIDNHLDDDIDNNLDDNDETTTKTEYEDLDDDDDETTTEYQDEDLDEDSEDKNENKHNTDVFNIDSTQTQTDQLSFMDEYGQRFASFFGDM